MPAITKQTSDPQIANAIVRQNRSEYFAGISPSNRNQ